MANGRVILGRYRDNTDKGWTTIIPHDDGTAASTKCYYIHPSLGDDANTGLDWSQPKATIASAATAIGTYQAGPRADWILLAEGQTFAITGGSNAYGIGTKGGYDSHTPFVLTSYNPDGVGITAATPRGTNRAAPPLLSLTSNSASSCGVFNYNTSTAGGPTYIIGIDLHCPTADPINSPGTYNSAVVGASLSLSFDFSGRGGLIMEDAHCVGGAFTTSSSSTAFNCYKPQRLRRCSWQFTPGIALLSSAASYFLLEECSFRHCGWGGNGGSNPDQLARATSVHSAYINTTQTGDGMQKRYILRGNFTYESSDVGLRCRHGGQVYNNFCMQDSTGIEVGVANMVSEPARDQCVDFHVHDNVILEGGTGTGGGGMLLAASNISGPNGGRLSGNLIAHTEPYDAWALTGPSDDEWTDGGGNTYYDCRNPSGGNDGGLLAAWNTSAVGMEDPTYLLSDYATDHLGHASLDEFLDTKFQQRRYNWDERYHAPYINDVIRSKYNMNSALDDRPPQRMPGLQLKLR
jgi:hypothetical protein